MRIKLHYRNLGSNIVHDTRPSIFIQHLHGLADTISRDDKLRRNPNYLLCLYSGGTNIAFLVLISSHITSVLIALNYMPLWFEYFHDHVNPFDDTELFSLNKGPAEVVRGLNLPLLQGAYMVLTQALKSEHYASFPRKLESHGSEGCQFIIENTKWVTVKAASGQFIYIKGISNIPVSNRR